MTYRTFLKQKSKTDRYTLYLLQDSVATGWKGRTVKSLFKHMTKAMPYGIVNLAWASFLDSVAMYQPDEYCTYYQLVQQLFI